MIYIINPPFVKGNNLPYLSLKLQEFLQNDDYAVTPKEVIERKGTGFYNNDRWMIDCLESSDNVIRNIKDGDTVVFVDFWNPTIQHVWIHARLNKIDIKIIGWFHGSTFLEDDYLVKSGFFHDDFGRKISESVRYAEYSWFGMCDQIWCASKYFATGIPQQFKNKILYLPEPFDSDEFTRYSSELKEWDIIYPFRLDKDKVNLPVLWYVINNMPNRKFLITTPSEIPLEMKNILNKMNNVKYIENCSGGVHLETLGKSKVIFSTAYQEGWGYSVLKGVALGCIPMLPNRAVYPELYHERFLYDGSEKDALYKLRHIFYSYNTYDFPQLPIKLGFNGFTFEDGLLQHNGDKNEGSNARRIV